MGGKKKQAERVKNNARPSNSGRSAEFLGTAINPVNFNSMKESGFTFSLPQMELEVDASVDGNFQMVLKKMSKKDATTKLKALHEFTELVKNTEPEAVKAILPFWPRLYAVLATDADHRVREATHLAHNQVVLKVKRNLAPYLKQLVGPWFTSQYDTYAPAASAASRSFRDAFPLNRMQEAIVFCQEEILNYICDNLTPQPTNSLSNPKSSNPDVSKAKYERVIISSLQGYSLYIQQVPEDVIQKAEDLNAKILGSSKFWKYAHMDVPQIRASWYAVVVAICEKAQFLLVGHEANVIKTVFNNLDETNPSVQAHLWEAALLSTKTIAEWWKLCNIEAKVLPKLWKILRQGGNGNATIIFPNLLPLISHFPATHCKEEFLLKFFDNLRSGLRIPSVRSSQCELRIISVSFVECLQYSLMKNHANCDLCYKLIKTQLMPVIDSTLIDSKAAHKTFFNQVSALIQFWHKNKDQEFPNYARFLDVFWSECESLFTVRLGEYAAQETGQVAKELCGQQIHFLIALKHTAKPRLKVQFATEDEAPKEAKRSDGNGQINMDQSYLQSLHSLAHKLCVFYIKTVDYSSEKKIPEMIENVVSLSQEFESDDLVQHLKQAFCASFDSNILILFELVFQWIQHESLARKSVIDLLFLLLKYANDDEAQQVLAKITLLESKDALGWCITSALSYPYNCRKVVQCWLGTEKVGQFLVDVVNSEVNDCSSSDLYLLLRQAFTVTNDDGDLFIPKSSITAIIHRLKLCLEDPELYTLTIDKCASLASYIASAVYTESSKHNRTSELFFALFTLACTVNEKMQDFISDDTVWEVNSAWQDALSTFASHLEKSEFLQLTEECANIMERIVLGPEISISNADRVIDIISKYLLGVERSAPSIVGLVANVFFQRKFVIEWTQQIQQLALEANYMSGLLCLPTSGFLPKLQLSLQDEHIFKYFSWNLLMINIMATQVRCEDAEEEDESDNNRWIKLMDNPEAILLDLMLDFSSLESILSHYKNIKKYSELQVMYSTFSSKLNELIETSESNTKQAMEKLLATNLEHQSQLWAPVAYKLHKLNVAGPYPSLAKEIGSANRLHLTQAFSKHNELVYDDVNRKMEALEAIVTLRCLWGCEEIDVQIAEVYGHIERLKNEEMTTKFYNLNMSNWEHMQIIIEIARLCSKMLVEKKPGGFTQRQWDFIVISLASWSGRLVDAKNLHANPQIASFILAVCELFVGVKAYVGDLRVDQPKCKYVDEWENVFVKTITTDIVKTWSYFAEKFSEVDAISYSQQTFLQSFGNVILHLQASCIFDYRVEGMPKWSKLLKQCCKLLIRPDHCLQLWAYHMLNVLSTGLIQVDAIAVDTNTPHEKGLIFEQFKDLLVQTHTIVSTMLLDYKLGEDSCRVEPFTDSYVYTFAYLLIWDILLRLCEKSSMELRYQYIDWLKKEDLLNNLLISIFKLMPLEVFACKTKSTHIAWFTVKSAMKFDEPITSEKIERLNCSVYASTMAQLPAAVRQWWSNSESRITQLVERVTAMYISPHLCAQELRDVSKHENNFKNLKVRVHETVREVVAVYTVDEAQMELMVTLPPNYPLGGPDVQCNHQIGGLPHKQWLMQLRMCVLHQNGRIWDALSLWNNNLDKKFDGVEECYICFAVLHPGTYQLPKLSCKTCRKKFHAACLYKWFSTSNKSTCPICRNLF